MHIRWSFDGFAEFCKFVNDYAYSLILQICANIYTSGICFSPLYFQGRNVASNRTLDWTNVYIQGDLLGSIFRDDNKASDPEVGVSSYQGRHDRCIYGETERAKISQGCPQTNVSIEVDYQVAPV